MVRGMDELIACRRCDSPYCHGCNIYLLSQMLCAGKLNAIKDENNTIIPTADVAPARYGHWVWNPDGMDWGLGAWVCSECHAKPGTWWEADKKYNPLRCSGGHFCGNCGARMDKGGDA